MAGIFIFECIQIYVFNSRVVHELLESGQYEVQYVMFSCTLNPTR